MSSEAMGMRFPSSTSGYSDNNWDSNRYEGSGGGSGGGGGDRNWCKLIVTFLK